MYTRFTCLCMCACGIALLCAYDGLVVDASEKENFHKRPRFKNMGLPMNKISVKYWHIDSQRNKYIYICGNHNIVLKIVLNPMILFYPYSLRCRTCRLHADYTGMMVRVVRFLQSVHVHHVHIEWVFLTLLSEKQWTSMIKLSHEKV